MKRLLRAIVGVAVATAAAASALPALAADDWLNLATVSMTNATAPKLADRYICYTDGRDIACNAPSLYVTTGGLVGINTTTPGATLGVNGTISATNFVGNGSGLTGVVAGSSDRIVSGTTSMVAISNTGYISLTQSGVNTGWFDPQTGFVTIGVSSTGPISGTNGYFNGRLAATGNGIIGGNLQLSGNLTATPLVSTSANGTVSATYGYFSQISATNIAANSVPWTGITGKPTSIVSLSTTTANADDVVYFDGTNYVGASATTLLGLGTMASQNANAVAITGGSAIGLTLVSGSAGGTVSGTHLYANQLSATTGTINTLTAGSIGAGAIAMSGNLTGAPLVSTSSNGKVSATYIYGHDGSFTTVTAGTFVGDGSGLTGVVAASGDRIVSGTTSMVAISDTGYISLTQSGVNTGWFDPQTGFVTIGVSSTGPISGTNGYFRGKVGIGTISPGDALEVNGSVIPTLHLSGDNLGAPGRYWGTTYSNELAVYNSNGIGISTAGSDMNFLDGSLNSRMFIQNSTGNVGIGTLSPTATLQVSGSMIVSSTGQTSTPTLYVGTNGRVGIGTSAPATDLGIGDGTAWATAIVYGPSSRQVAVSANQLRATGDALYLSAESEVILRPSSTEAVRLTKTGLVGIGTSAPSTSLHLNNPYTTSRTEVTLSYPGSQTSGYLSYRNDNLYIGTNGSGSGYGAVQIGAANSFTFNAGTSDYLIWGSPNGSRRGKVGMNVYSFGITSGLEVSGTVSATDFVGNGSGLTGITAASSDRIVSGTTSMVAVSNTGFVSLTQSAVNTAWFDPQKGFVTIGVSSTGGISGTTGYFTSSVGIGTSNVTATLSVVAPTGQKALWVSGAASATALSVNAAGHVSVGRDNANDQGGVNFEVYGDQGMNVRYDNGKGMLIRQNSSAGEVQITNQASSPLYLGTSNTTQVTIDSAGKVGIGTTAPNAKVEVASNGVPANSGNMNTGLVVGNIPGGISLNVGAYDTGALSGSYGWLSAGYVNVAGTHAPLALQPNGGNVGIGATSPTDRLTVSTSTQYDGIQLRNSSNRIVELVGLGSSNDNGALALYNGGATGALIQAAGSSYLLGGNVGIGALTPSATLSVIGEVQVSSTGASCSNALTGAIRYTSGTGVQYCNSAVWTTLASGAGVTGAGSATAVAFWNSSAGLTYDAGLYWDNSNKRLGVGTTTPTQAFEVSGSLRISKSNGNPTAVIKIPDATALGQFSVNDETGYQSYYGFIGSNAGQGARNSTTEVGSRNTDITLRPGETETMRLTTAGKVGIGTTTPGSSLEVSGGNVLIQGESNPAVIVSNSLGYTSLGVVQATGNVLEYGVAGDITLRAGGGPAGTGANLILGVRTPNGAIKFGTGAPGASTHTEKMRLTSAGYLGLNTQSPTATLQVSGTFIVSNSAQVTTPSIYVSNSGNVGIGTSSPGTTRLLISADAATTSLLQLSDTNGGRSFIFSPGAGTGDRTKFNIYDAVSGTVRMTFDTGNAYVGIGTVSPQANLDVSGSIFHSGIITDLSDRRMKQNIQVLPSTLQKVLSLLPVSYQKKATPGLTEYGFIAQDMLATFPNLVTTANDPSRTMSLNYIGLIAPTIRALQEVEARRQLDAAATVTRLEALKAANDNLVAETEALRTQLKAANDNLVSETTALRREIEAGRDLRNKEIDMLQTEVERLKRLSASGRRVHAK